MCRWFNWIKATNKQKLRTEATDSSGMVGTFYELSIEMESKSKSNAEKLVCANICRWKRKNHVKWKKEKAICKCKMKKCEHLKSQDKGITHLVVRAVGTNVAFLQFSTHNCLGILLFGLVSFVPCKASSSSSSQMASSASLHHHCFPFGNVCSMCMELLLLLLLLLPFFSSVLCICTIHRICIRFIEKCNRTWKTLLSCFVVMLQDVCVEMRESDGARESATHCMLVCMWIP